MSKPHRVGMVSGHHHEAVAPPHQDGVEDYVIIDVQQLKWRIESVNESTSWGDELSWSDVLNFVLGFIFLALLVALFGRFVELFDNIIM